jgi:hypothetical protein
MITQYHRPLSVTESLTTATGPVSSAGLRDRIARGLLAVSAAGALASLTSAFPTATGADTGTVVLAWHDLLGFPVYAGLFALLASRPRGYPGVWELLIVQKAAMAVIATGLARGSATDATLTAAVDGGLALVLIVAYVLARGDLAWRHSDLAARSAER